MTFKGLLTKVKTHYLKYFSKRVEFGKGVKIDWPCRLDIWKGKLILDDSVHLKGYKKGYHAAMYAPTTIFIDVEAAKVEVGSYTRINGAFIHAQNYIKIGKSCVIASNVNILDCNGHQTVSYDRTIGRDKPAPVIIGDNVWIGINATILKGVVIGDNSIVSAGSVVNKDVPSNCIVMGNPAVVVKRINFDVSDT